MPQPTATRTTPLLLRPAVIELRYNDAAAFKKAIDVYQDVLSNSGASGTNVYNFKVGSVGGRPDILLRLFYNASEPDATANRTIVYWEVARNEQAGLESAHERLLTLGFAKVEGPEVSRPFEIPGLGDPPAGLSARSVVADGVGNPLGLTINPPVPTIAIVQPTGSSDFVGKIGAVGFALLAALVGFVFCMGLRRTLTGRWW